MEQFIHIGCPKTASTTLQNNLFARHPEIASIGKPYESREGQLATQIYRLITKDDENFDFGECEEIISKQKSRDMEGVKAIMLSEEKIFVSPSFSSTALRLKRLFPSAKIIITIRNQLDLIVSWYCQGCYNGRYWKWAGIQNEYGESYITLNQFLDFTFSNNDKNVSEIFHFYKKATIFTELFGKENVFVFPIEQLKTDSTDFVEGLSKVMGIDNRLAFDLMKGRVENRRNTGNLSMYRLKTKIEPFMDSPLLGSILRSDCFEQIASRLVYKFAQYNISLSEDWKKRITEIYRDDNRLLSEKFRLDLSKYHYPI